MAGSGIAVALPWTCCPAWAKGEKPVPVRDCESLRRSGASHADLREWYAHELSPKVARAVAQGRVDAASACELQRLMTEMLETGRLPGAGAEPSR